MRRGIIAALPMRTLFAAALLVLAATMAAADARKPLSIAVESLGDRDQGVVARIFFRFANPHQITEAGLFLEGVFIQKGRVPRSFRLAVPRKHDRFVWNTVTIRNGKTTRLTRWSVLPDQRNEISMVHTFTEGEAEIRAWLVLEGDYGASPLQVAQTTETFRLAKTNQPFTAGEDEAESLITEEEEPEPAGAVAIRAPRRNSQSNLLTVGVDVEPPVKRVEFYVQDKKILARNAPPYNAEFDVGNAEPVALRAIGYDAAGHYVDADLFVVNENDDGRIAVKITRVVTPDGFSHFKLTVRNPGRVELQSIALYADDRKLLEWVQPPYALSVSTASLAGVKFIRASVIDVTGFEAADQLKIAPQ